MKLWIWRWGPAILVMALIFFASSTPGSDLPKFGFYDFLVKKGGHMLGYGLLTAALLHALNKGGKITKLQLLLAALLAIIYAATDEFHQLFTPGRSSSIVDLGIDTIGCLAGIAIWQLIRVRRLNPDKAVRSPQS
jgi:VanZ family protein